MLVCVHLCEDQIKNAVSLPFESERVHWVVYFQGSRVMKVAKAEFIREQSRCGKSRALYLSKVRINDSSNNTRHQPPH